MNILIVEDNNISRMVIKKFLEGLHYQIYEARNGFEGRHMWETLRPDILITDWNMPYLDGIDLVKYIRANDDSNYTYIIVTTERDEIGDLKSAFDAGADDYIKKPMHKQELLLRLQAGERLLNLQTKDQLLFALAKLAEVRDNETGEHLERIRLYSRTLSHMLFKMGIYLNEINYSFLKNIYETSPLHDIGKVAIPDDILKKKGKLTEDEFVIMRNHTVIGRNTLMEVIQHGWRPYLKMAIEISGSHHEWWDGSGYPDGLKGSEIPLAARIIALADVYDAMRSKRIYKEIQSHAEVVDQIIALSGTQFDPFIVKAFLECEKSFYEISLVYENQN